MAINLFCTKCGSKLADEQNFCSSCGNKIDYILDERTIARIRRYDIDAIRIIALGLLILYHIIVGFQPWGIYISFITNKQSLETIWKFMEMINIWRIPILFVVSGMGVCFAMERRNCKQLLQDRMFRIFIPYVFGFFFVVPIYLAIFNSYYDKPQFYFPNPGHLWFLGYILFYILLLLPLFNYFRNHPDNVFIRLLASIVRKPLGIVLIFALPLMIEAILVNPDTYAGFALDPIHGLSIGIICFSTGFVFVSLKDVFWDAVIKVKWITVVFALSFYLLRVLDFDISSPSFLENIFMSFESANWMLSAFGFGATFLNRPYKPLAYLRMAVYPVYIVHMPVQFFFSSLIFPLSSPVFVKLMLVLIATYGGSLLIFEIVRRFKWIRFLFGIRG